MFKRFCTNFLDTYPGNYRSDFIRDALCDKNFPWKSEKYYAINYLDRIRADPSCIACYEELVEMHIAKIFPRYIANGNARAPKKSFD